MAENDGEDLALPEGGAGRRGGAMSTELGERDCSEQVRDTAVDVVVVVEGRWGEGSVGVAGSGMGAEEGLMKVVEVSC